VLVLCCRAYLLFCPVPLRVCVLGSGWRRLCLHVWVVVECSSILMIDQKCVLMNWNVRGLNNSAPRKVVRDLATDTGCTIVCL
jgi:hypothetical protein